MGRANRTLMSALVSSRSHGLYLRMTTPGHEDRTLSWGEKLKPLGFGVCCHCKCIIPVCISNVLIVERCLLIRRIRRLFQLLLQIPELLRRFSFSRPSDSAWAALGAALNACIAAWNESSGFLPSPRCIHSPECSCTRLHTRVVVPAFLCQRGLSCGQGGLADLAIQVWIRTGTG